MSVEFLGLTKLLCRLNVCLSNKRFHPIKGYSIFTIPLEGRDSIKREIKNVEWRGNSKSDFKSFPKGVTNDMGIQLLKVQYGRLPDSFDTIKLPSGTTYEIRHKGPSGIYRVIYIASVGTKIYVLHAFKKKDTNYAKSGQRISGKKTKRTQ